MIDKVKSLKYRRACPPDWSDSGVSGCWSDDVLPEKPLGATVSAKKELAAPLEIWGRFRVHAASVQGLTGEARVYPCTILKIDPFR